MKCDVDICKNLYAVVVLSSSTTIFPRVGEHRTCELRAPWQKHHHVGAECFHCTELLFQTSYATVVVSRHDHPQGIFSSAPKEPTALAPSTMRSRWSLRFGMDWRICLVFPQLSADIDLEGRVRCILPQASTVREFCHQYVGNLIGECDIHMLEIRSGSFTSICWR